MSISYNELRKAPFRPLLPDVHFIELNKLDQLNSIDDKTACVFLETIQGDAGVRIPKKEFLIGLRDKCNQTETLLIFDEVQCGIGRTGKMFAFEHFDVIPDILTLGKSLGAGMPIGAMVTNQKLMSLLSDNPTLGHITTFGGHPVVMAAAEAGLKVIKEEQLLDKVEAKGVLLEKLLQHASIVEIRRIGLMFALEFESPEIVQKVVENCLSKRVLTFWFLSNPNSIRLAPPLIITETQIEETAKLIVEAINESI
jgi:acetylornithine/succinyldiaminopimelate/putrescine aminotransferase